MTLHTIYILYKTVRSHGATTLEIAIIREPR